MLTMHHAKATIQRVDSSKSVISITRRIVSWLWSNQIRDIPPWPWNVLVGKKKLDRHTQPNMEPWLPKEGQAQNRWSEAGASLGFLEPTGMAPSKYLLNSKLHSDLLCWVPLSWHLLVFCRIYSSLSGPGTPHRTREAHLWLLDGFCQPAWQWKNTGPEIAFAKFPIFWAYFEILIFLFKVHVLVHFAFRQFGVFWCLMWVLPILRNLE